MPAPRSTGRIYLDHCATSLETAVAAGKHVFCEKPHGIDMPGLKVSMAAAEDRGAPLAPPPRNRVASDPEAAPDTEIEG
mgnify:CR=1 FL=1